MHAQKFVEQKPKGQFKDMVSAQLQQYHSNAKKTPKAATVLNVQKLKGKQDSYGDWLAAGCCGAPKGRESLEMERMVV